MWLRAQESALASVTGGNGAIYAVRREAYVEVDPIMGHDLSLPVPDGQERLARGLRAARRGRREKMVPSIEGEWARKRRMMSHGWPIVIKGGLLDPRGYPPLYALMIVTHRLLRYGTPFLHVLTGARHARAAAPRPRLPARRGRAGRAAGRRVRPAAGARPPLVARYYVLTTAALAAGLYDWLRHGTAGRLGRARRARGEPATCTRAASARSTSRVAGALRCSSRAGRRARRAARPAGVATATRSTASAASAATGTRFEVYKLRTMVSGAEHMGAGLAVDEGDARITRVGALLRRTSIDELPNLVNVLRGEMSLVGPRPTLQVQVDPTPTASAAGSTVRPGLTGWAQVNGRASLPWPERIELDLWYLEHASLRLDLRILVLSARMAITGHGLYRGETGGWR